MIQRLIRLPGRPGPLAPLDLVVRDPTARIRDISAATGLTEGTVQAIVADLAAEGYITRTRTGRRTIYTVNPDSLFRHPTQTGLRVGRLLTLLTEIQDHDESQPTADPSS
jgi:hypothetical protein